MPLITMIKHTKAHKKGVIGLDMALGTTWPQHNQHPQIDHPTKRKIYPNQKLILSKALNERVRRSTFFFTISTDFFRIHNGSVHLCTNQLVSFVKKSMSHEYRCANQLVTEHYRKLPNSILFLIINTFQRSKKTIQMLAQIDKFNLHWIEE